MPLLKLIFELGPLVVFFLANNRYDIFVATGGCSWSRPCSL